jgi:flagellar basal-body rod modification protein FlgD
MVTNATTAATGAAVPTLPPPTNPGGRLGKDEFLKMLIAQLKNQDPLNPLQGEEMAAHLAQFSSLEQLIDINTQLVNQASANEALAQTMNSGVALNTLGRDVVAIGNQVAIPSEGAAAVTVSVGNAGGTGTLRIYDASGREVGSRSLGAVSGGRQTFELGSAAAGLPPGAYTYAVEVVDGDGNSVPTQTFTVGRVDGIQYGSTGPVLTSGPLTITLGSIVEIGTGN